MVIHFEIEVPDAVVKSGGSELESRIDREVEWVRWKVNARCRDLKRALTKV